MLHYIFGGSFSGIVTRSPKTTVSTEGENFNCTVICISLRSWCLGRSEELGGKPAQQRPALIGGIEEDSRTQHIDILDF